MVISRTASLAPAGRRFLRPAGSILAKLEASWRKAAPILLPQQAWNSCLDLKRLHEESRRRGWRTAARRLEIRLASSLAALICAAREASHTCVGDAPAPTRASLRSLCEDLAALTAEFPKVEFDLRERRLWVVTDSIELEELDFGRFRIVLRWDRLGEHQPYLVEALDARPAASDSGVTHPHIRDAALCEGEGKTAIRAALEEGRLFDFFLLVRQILENYHSASAYVRLEDWTGVTCADCGSLTDRESPQACERCDADLCSDCVSHCSECGRSLCCDCCNRCACCESDFCGSDLNACATCGEKCCRRCFTAGVCETCRETLEESHEDVEADDVAATTTAATDP